MFAFDKKKLFKRKFTQFIIFMEIWCHGRYSLKTAASKFKNILITRLKFKQSFRNIYFEGLIFRKISGLEPNILLKD